MTDTYDDGEVSQWTRWFAWYPVRAKVHRHMPMLVWMTMVYRRRIAKLVSVEDRLEVRHVGRWEYRVPGYFPVNEHLMNSAQAVARRMSETPTRHPSFVALATDDEPWQEYPNAARIDQTVHVP